MQLTSGVDLHGLVNLADRVVDLVMNPDAVDGVDFLDVEGDWEFLFAKGSVYEPSVAAGLVGLSSALAAAVSEETLDAGTMFWATEPIDRLPTLETRNEGSISFAGAFRRYQFVPTADALRRLWISFANARQAAPGSADASTADRVFRQVWRQFVEVRNELADRVIAIRGLVLIQLANLVEPTALAERSLDFTDLVDLAERKDWVLEQHGGSAAVGLVFQRRVTELMMTFNCRVAAARTGEALGDIYLELPDGDFILVDAKSTSAKGGYSLPKSDQDALVRYQANAKSILPLGRRIRTVLIVGPAPANNLPSRLSRLESPLGCDVRFTTATQLAEFRHAFHGGPLIGLDRVLHNGEHVLGDGWWQPLVDASKAENDRLADYLRKGLSDSL